MLCAVNETFDWPNGPFTAQILVENKSPQHKTGGNKLSQQNKTGIKQYTENKIKNA